MATIAEMLHKLKMVDLPREIPIIIQRNSDVAANLNRSQLYNKAINSDGINLTPYRSVNYALRKNNVNPSPGLFNPDLYLTGAFQKGFYAQVKSGTTILFGSTDMKSSDLERKYTNKIFGLTRDSKQIFLDETIMPEIRLYITNVTGLKFS